MFEIRTLVVAPLHEFLGVHGGQDGVRRLPHGALCEGARQQRRRHDILSLRRGLQQQKVALGVRERGRLGAW